MPTPSQKQKKLCLLPMSKPLKPMSFTYTKSIYTSSTDVPYKIEHRYKSFQLKKFPCWYELLRSNFVYESETQFCFFLKLLLVYNYAFLFIYNSFFLVFDFDWHPSLNLLFGTIQSHQNIPLKFLYFLASLVSFWQTLLRESVFYFFSLRKICMYNITHDDSLLVFCMYAGVMGGDILWKKCFCLFLMLFRCLKFAVRDRNSNLAMAKSSFMLEHPLGMLFLINLFVRLIYVVWSSNRFVSGRSMLLCALSPNAGKGKWINWAGIGRISSADFSRVIFAWLNTYRNNKYGTLTHTRVCNLRASVIRGVDIWHWNLYFLHFYIIGDAYIP